MKASSLIVAVLLSWAAGAQAGTVRWLHIEQNPDAAAFYADVARRFEAANPGTTVEMQFLENESFKKKLTTLLQSPDKPHIIYSWGGGVLREQVKAGVIEDITAAVDSGGWRDRLSPSAWGTYSVKGRVYGVPMNTSQVVFFYNKDLFAKAGVGGDAIKTWDDLLAAVKKLQAAGITPIVAGGADKWPLHFYWSHLAIRVGGRAAFEAASAGEGQGFAGETFVRAGELFKQLVDLKPFQPGFLAATWPQAAGQFGDGKGAMMLMGNWISNAMAANSANKVGIPDDKLGWFAFPSVPGGRGAPEDTLGGMNGWLVTKGAPKEAAEFLRFFLDVQNQRIAGERGFYIPVTKGAAEAVKRPMLKAVAGNVGRSPYHQLFYDQMLGPSVGAVVNDVSADLAAGRVSPAEAANKVHRAWQQAN
ncbi:MAG: extracellular solute-binding protein [Burkholderiales bacterium]|nr:extracellular solute-binding protein [Burkholderiales bacterium]